MLLDTSLTIAYKCKDCGSFQFVSISLFDIINKNVLYYMCDCKQFGVSIVKKNFNTYEIVLPCLACEDNHVYSFLRKEILSNKLITFNCDRTGVHTCFIGMDDEVRKSVDMVEEELDHMLDDLGYDSYFKNTQVMFDVLNRLHDLAEKGNLICQCKVNDIELTLFCDRIFLRCLKCNGEKVLKQAPITI